MVYMENNQLSQEDRDRDKLFKQTRRQHRLRNTKNCFTKDEYMYLHLFFLKGDLVSPLELSIKKKEGICLNLSEIDLIKRRYAKWFITASNVDKQRLITWKAQLEEYDE